MKIASKNIGNHLPVYIIAELSANHCGSFEIAKDTIKTAYNAGADAIKIQTYTADTITIDCNNEYFQVKSGTIWDGKSLYELYKEAYTPWEWQAELKKYAEEIGITLFSSPFDKTAVDFLEDINVPAYKIASFEAVDIPLIKYTASKGKPIIISTGICSKKEIQEAIDACYEVGNKDIALLKCTSSYPAPLEEMNLSLITDMQQTFNVPVGLSDHTLNIETPIVAASLGACVIEKHFVIDRDLGGPDASFSMNPVEFEQMVKSVRNTEKLLGNPTYELSAKSINNRQFARSLFVVKDIKKGEIFTKENIKSIRPGNGLPPKLISNIIGKTASKDLNPGTPLSEEHIL